MRRAVQPIGEIGERQLALLPRLFLLHHTHQRRLELYRFGIAEPRPFVAGCRFDGRWAVEDGRRAIEDERWHYFRLAQPLVADPVDQQRHRYRNVTIAYRR